MSSSFVTRIVLLLAALGLVLWLTLGRSAQDAAVTAAVPAQPNSAEELKRQVEQMQKEGIKPACRPDDPLCAPEPAPTAE
jgi:hypothetical protein